MTAGLWVVAVILLAAAVVLGVLLARSGPSEVAQRDAAVALSEEFVLALAAYDHRDLDAEADEVLRLATGSFRDDYEETFGAAEFRQALEESGSVATAEVAVGPLLAELGADEARTFTVVEQTVEAEGLDEPETRRLRVELLLVRVSDGWKVNAVQLT